MSGHSHDFFSLLLGADLSQLTAIVPLAVLIASLIGSPHCAIMCGPLAVSFAGDRKRFYAYHLGRFLSYATVGALAGAFGQSVLTKARYPWVSGFAVGFIAIAMIYLGLRAWHGKPLHVRLPKLLEKYLEKIWRILPQANLPGPVVGGIAGALTVFLPCGHLYGFIVGSVATGSALNGAIFMAAFWLGTVPALGFGASFLKKYAFTGGRRFKWAGGLLILAGVFTLMLFSKNLYALYRAEPQREKGRHHGAIISLKDLDSAKKLSCH